MTLTVWHPHQYRHLRTEFPPIVVTLVATARRRDGNQFKQQASEVARRVSGGKEIITITDSGDAVARLVPVEDAESKRLHAGAI